MDLSNTLISAEVLLDSVPPMKWQHRLTGVQESGVDGGSERHYYPLTLTGAGELLPADRFEDLQEGLLKRALKEGIDKWDVISDPTLRCPCCGFENIHQQTVIDDGSQHRSLAIAYNCESCPATSHLQVLQHKGCSYLFWDAKQLLEDFGVYRLAEAIITDRKIKRRSALSSN